MKKKLRLRPRGYLVLTRVRSSVIKEAYWRARDEESTSSPSGAFLPFPFPLSSWIPVPFLSASISALRDAKSTERGESLSGPSTLHPSPSPNFSKQYPYSPCPTLLSAKEEVHVKIARGRSAFGMK